MNASVEYGNITRRGIVVWNSIYDIVHIRFYANGWLAYVLVFVMFLIHVLWMWRNLLAWGNKPSENLQPLAVIVVHVMGSRCTWHGKQPHPSIWVWLVGLGNLGTGDICYGHPLYDLSEHWPERVHFIIRSLLKQSARHGWRWNENSSCQDGWITKKGAIIHKDRSSYNDLLSSISVYRAMQPQANL